MRTRTHFVSALLTLAACLTWPATAQTVPDLSAENQRLQNEVDRLQRELKTAQDRVKALENQVAALQKARPSTTQAAEPDKVTVDESKPDASPRALFNALVKSYQDAMGAHDMGAAGDAKRKGYMRKLEQWKGQVDREYRGPIKWHVRKVDTTPIQHGHAMTLVAVDPVTDVELGLPFEMTPPRHLTERLIKLEQRGELGVLVLRGTLTPDVNIAAERQNVGPIDNPPFIGPFAEFLFTVTPQSLLPVKEDESEQKDPKGEKPKP